MRDFLMRRLAVPLELYDLFSRLTLLAGLDLTLFVPARRGAEALSRFHAQHRLQPISSLTLARPYGDGAYSAEVTLIPAENLVQWVHVLVTPASGETAGDGFG